MEREDQLVAALRALCEREGGYKAVADKARVSPDNLWQVLAAVKLPSGKARGVGPNLRDKLSAAFPGWLNRTTQVIASEPSTTFGTPTVIADDLTIPQYDAAGAMGNGLILEERQPGIIKAWRVDREWLRLNVGHHSGLSNLCIVTGFGPSMKPKFNPGDPLLLDIGVTTVETEGIYFFRVGQHGFIKQLQRIPTEAGLVIRAKSLNPNYDPFDITAKMDFQVFGKVLTVWRSEQV
jgi:hypothetical protein